MHNSQAQSYAANRVSLFLEIWSCNGMPLSRKKGTTLKVLQKLETGISDYLKYHPIAKTGLLLQLMKERALSTNQTRIHVLHVWCGLYLKETDSTFAFVEEDVSHWKTGLLLQSVKDITLSTNQTRIHVLCVWCELCLKEIDATFCLIEKDMSRD